MPDHIGAFLKASRCFAELGINISRVSYNKAVDSHKLFIDAEGESDKLELAGEMLASIGYLQNDARDSKVVLLEFRLIDRPGSVTGVLELINSYQFNISYISSQENGTEYQLFKMGLYVDNEERLRDFLAKAEQLCEVRIIDYDHTERIFDNSIFYNSYVHSLAQDAELGEQEREELLVNINLAMQTLDERGLSPYRTFDSIARFAQLLTASKREAFTPRLSRFDVSDRTRISLIEPDCGGNTAIIESCGERLFIDSGYACYESEMLEIIRSLVPDFKARTERVLVTHADLDHCGLLGHFDEVLTSQATAECLRLEYEGSAGFREQNFLHKPYINICKILTRYKSVEPERLKPLWKRSERRQPLERIGDFSLGELEFEVYEGSGGHLPGETVLIDRRHRIAFSGDIYINIGGMTAKQAEYNRYAPILMTSVDTDAQLCTDERKAFLQLLGEGEWQIFGGHGERKTLQSG